MISPTTKQETSRLHRREVRARTVEMLKIEIEFIDNPEFRDLNDKALLEEARHLLASARRGGARDNRVMQLQLKTLCSYPLLEKEEETAVFRVMNSLKYRANVLRATLDPKRPSIRRVRAIEERLELANDLRNHAVKANTRLVVSVAKSFLNDKIEIDELISEGLSGLIRVVEKFDYGRGFRFSTYATWAIRNRMLRLREQTQRYSNRFYSGADEQTFERPSDVDPQVQAAEQQEMSDLVRAAMDVLDDRERLIIASRAGFRELDYDPTYKNLGKILGVCKERVRQIQSRGLDKVRNRLSELTSKHRRT